MGDRGGAGWMKIMGIGDKKIKKGKKGKGTEGCSG